MKRRVILLVLSALSGPLNISAASANPDGFAEVIAEVEVDAGQHGCDASYAARLGRYEEHATRRQIIKYTIMGTTAVIAAGAYFGAVMATGGLAEVGMLILMSSALPGSAAWGLTELVYYKIDREDDYGAAASTLVAARLTELELQTLHYEKRVRQRVAAQNQVRATDGLPPLSPPEVEIIRQQIPFGARWRTGIDPILEKLKKKGVDVSYEVARQRVLEMNSENVFCPAKRNGKPKLMTDRQMKRTVVRTFLAP